MQLLRYQSTGQAVNRLQQRLVSTGYLAPNSYQSGTYCRATAQAVLDLQSIAALTLDGIYGKNTHAALMQRDTSHRLTTAQIAAAAHELSIDVASMQAVINVESDGSGFDNSGQPKILFERHIMRRRLLIKGISGARLAAIEHRYPTLVNREPGGYIGGSAEHLRLAEAQYIDANCALESASWGLFQIMGYHWHKLGYNSIDEFADAMHTSESSHLTAFVRFVKLDEKMLGYLRRREWSGFAAKYNGPAYRKNLYDKRLAIAYTKAQVNNV